MKFIDVDGSGARDQGDALLIYNLKQKLLTGQRRVAV